MRLQRLRVLAFGCPRPGSPVFTDWFRRELQLDSCNVILYDEQIGSLLDAQPGTKLSSPQSSKRGSIDQEYDPAPLQPPLKYGFDFHPNCFILHKRFGTLRPLGKLEKSHIELLVTKVTD